MTNAQLQIQLDVKRNQILKLEERVHRQKKKIAELEAKNPKWISVDDNLPNEYEQVLVFDDDSIYCAELGDFEGFKRWVTPWFSAMVELTYWMPLPKPPKTKETAND